MGDGAQNVSSLTRQRQPWSRATDIDYNDLKAISTWICLPFVLPSFSKSVHSGPGGTIAPWGAGSAIWKDIKSCRVLPSASHHTGLSRGKREF